MKRGIVIAIVAIALIALVAVLFWNMAQPGVPDYAKKECKGDPSDYKNCIGREKLIAACYDIEDKEKQVECFDNSTYNGLETPEVEITTGRLSE